MKIIKKTFLLLALICPLFFLLGFVTKQSQPDYYINHEKDIAINEPAPQNADGHKQDTITVTLDTINIRGFVYKTDGKPAKNMNIGLLIGFHAPGYPNGTKTDTSGYFTLKGIDPNGKLSFIDGNYSYTAFPIKGSRYMVIYLPPPKIIDVTYGDSVVISAARKHQRIKPSYRISDERGFPNLTTYYPEYKGGINKLISYIRQNLVYPEKAIDNNIEGMVEVAFTINKDGSASDFRVLQGIGYGCDEEVVSLLKKIEPWRPGLNGGRIFTITATLSVNFKLTDK